ncbi:hypothetical protein M408DRAFT_332684 [Serendipita vermifera MAFF 305830]|uniref:Uncharacterized protein n=1 Tax=Serendipita vermifera MAFF 305830 TaxID=933852 RepID=A0A0C3AE33_SERVB|nr:hypothetical protein M408DRAFT_332684 [Serendipita vermifera MAFF 305830]
MGDEVSPTDQPLPEWMTWSAITNADGSEGFTIVSLPLTYYGPSIPLGPDWTYGGETSPAPTDEALGPTPTPDPLAEPAPTAVTVTVIPEPSTTTVYITLPPVTVTVTALPSTSASFSTTPSLPSLTQSAFPSVSASFSPSLSLPSPTLTSGSSSTINPSSSISNTGASFTNSSPSTSNAGSSSSSSSSATGTSTAVPPFVISSSSGSARPPTQATSATLTGVLSSSSSGTLSNTQSTTRQSPSNIEPSRTTSSTTDAAPESVSALPSVTGTAHTYLGLQPDAFLGVILAIVLSVIIFLCCILCWIRHRRRRKRREQAALPPPTTGQTSRLLAGDRDPTREDLAYPYTTNHGREYRRSQIAMMRARGELDDEWEDRLYSPSMRSASVRLPEDEVGTSYGIRERAFAAAGVYGYTPVPRGPPSFGTGRGSAGASTQVPTITPANAGVGAAARASPTPRKDTRSTDQTNDSSAIHMYAAGGRSRTGSNEGADGLFYQGSEGEAPSPVASSSDLHFLQRLGSQGTNGVAALAAARAAKRHAPTNGSGSSGSNKNGSSEVPRTRNLEELPRAAIAYPESPVSDDQENSRLMPESEGAGPSTMVMKDTPTRHVSGSSKESGLSRWIHGSERSNHSSQSQHTPILQRVLHRVMGNRASTQPAFAIVPPSGPEPVTEQYNEPSGNRVPSRDFDFGNGLLFPRPPVHTGYSSGANTAKDDMRRWGGLLPSRLSSGNNSGVAGNNADASTSAQGSRTDINAASQAEADRARALALGVPIMANRDLIPQMKERAPTPGSSSLLGFGLRPPPPSAFAPERNASLVSSGRSTVYYDARSSTSTPMGTLERAPSPLARYDSPPPNPTTALRNMQSAQSFQTAASAPFLPPGLYDESEPEEVDALDIPPPMPTRDVRQARSLNTIFSVGTAETYGTAQSPLSFGRVIIQDEQTRVPQPGFDPAPRTIRSVPSDIAPSEAADADLGAGAYSSFGRASSRRDYDMAPVDEDILEDEPPRAASQWKALSTHSREDSIRGSAQGQSRNLPTDYLNWRLTLGQSFSIAPPGTDSPRHSQLGDFIAPHEGPNYDSQGSRDSSNRTNVSHSRDIHSLRASEGGMSGTAGSKDSKGSTQTGSSQHRSVSEYGHLRHPGKASGSAGDALLSAFGPGPSRQPGGGAGGTMDSAGDITAPSPVKKSQWWDSSPEVTRPRTLPAASAVPGIRLVGSRPGSNEAGTSGQGPSSAPVQPTRGWPAQGVPLDVTAADGRQSQSHSFIHRDSPASLRSYAPLHSHSPEPALSHSLSPLGGGAARDLVTRLETSASHSQDHSHSQHTHGTHGAETTMGTMTSAPTEDDHVLQEPDAPLSDVEQILRVPAKETKTVQGQEEEHGRGRIGGGIVPPNVDVRMPRWQQL